MQKIIIFLTHTVIIAVIFTIPSQNPSNISVLNNNMFHPLKIYISKIADDTTTVIHTDELENPVIIHINIQIEPITIKYNIKSIKYINSIIINLHEIKISNLNKSIFAKTLIAQNIPVKVIVFTPTLIFFT